MTMLRQQEKELKRTEGKLTRQLNRLNQQRADGTCVSLPTIALSEVSSLTATTIDNREYRNFHTNGLTLTGIEK